MDIPTAHFDKDHYMNPHNAPKEARPRFVMVVGTIREVYPDIPEFNGGAVHIYDRQERRVAVTLTESYAQALCLETTRRPESMPFTLLENWLNSLTNDELESEGLKPTDTERFDGTPSTLSPCCGVEFDEDLRICPKCKEHV